MKLNKIWSFAELLTYDYFMYLDKTEPSDILKKRDRKIYLASGAKRETKSPQLARVWFEAMISRTGDFPPVIRALLKAGRLLTPVIIASGLLFGIIYGLGMLKYTGKNAVNLIGIFSLLVLLPLLSNIIAISAMIMRKRFRGRIPAKVTLWLFRKISPLYFSSEEKKRSGTAFLNDLAVRLRKYGSAPIWLLTARINLYSLMVVTGILLAVFLGGIFHDLAFTWQTTLDVTPQTVSRIVEVIALPWHNFAPGAVPTIENIAGSRGILKDGISFLDNRDLSAWWEFLCLSILFYAVIPRALILAASFVAEKISFARISFSDAESLSLFRRMRSPLIDSGAQTFIADSPLRTKSSTATADVTARYHNKTVFSVFIPDDIKLEEKTIRNAVEKNLHGICDKIYPVELDEDSDAEIWQRAPSNNSFVLILEGWQPCTGEHIEYVAAMRKNTGGKKLIAVGLIWNTCKNSSFADNTDLYKDWQYQLSSLRDPALEVLKFDL